MRSSLTSISPSASPPPASVFSSSFRLLSSRDCRHTLPPRHRRCASEMRDNVLVVRTAAAQLCGVPCDLLASPRTLLLLQIVWPLLRFHPGSGPLYGCWHRSHDPSATLVHSCRYTIAMSS
jgi:hypothetical protein